MSVQNGERLATKQDLADMYQGILPYLGGMPEVLANKFSKGDLYSTEEKMIGQWVDGKPLYQRVFHLNSLPNNTQTDYTLDVANVDYVASIEGVASIYDSVTNELIMRPLPYIANSSTSTIGIWLDKQNGTVKVTIATGSNRSDHEAYIILKYTKIIDSANSFNIGESTDYSTEEKIVGTWITGEPVYQKTITGLNIKFNWISTQVTMASNVDALIDDVDTIIKIPHAIMENNSGMPTTCNVDIQNNGTKWNLVSVEDYYLKNITIQYTKTTTT